jgi:hypothetical protein
LGEDTAQPLRYAPPMFWVATALTAALVGVVACSGSSADGPAVNVIADGGFTPVAASTTPVPVQPEVSANPDPALTVPENMPDPATLQDPDLTASDATVGDDDVVDMLPNEETESSSASSDAGSPSSLSAHDAGAGDILDSGDDATDAGVDAGIDGQISCETIFDSRGEQGCWVIEICAGLPRDTTCSLLEDGWFCECSGSGLVYHLADPGEESACDTVSKICEAKVQPDFESELACEVTTQEADSVCTVSAHCSRSTQLVPGVEVEQRRSTTQTCLLDVAGDGLTCQCAGGVTGTSYTLTDVPITSACDPGLQVCTPDSEVAFVGDAECTLADESASQTGCTLYQDCVQGVQLDGGTLGTFNTRDSMSCTFEGDLALCVGAAGGRRVSVLLPMAVPESACGDAVRVGRSRDVTPPEGPIECVPLFVNASSGGCDADIRCSQQSVVAGRDVAFYADVKASCEPTDGNWACACLGSSGYGSFYVNTTDSSEACSIAAERCPELVYVGILPE